MVGDNSFPVTLTPVTDNMGTVVLLVVFMDVSSEAVETLTRDSLEAKDSLVDVTMVVVSTCRLEVVEFCIWLDGSVVLVFVMAVIVELSVRLTPSVLPTPLIFCWACEGVVVISTVEDGNEEFLVDVIPC